ncbi:MAG: sigma-70 family RNA polymerase sigma factor [Acidobacteriota bacterium]
MTNGDARRTPLGGIMEALGLRAADVVRAADAIAKSLGIDSISRRHFGRLLTGEGAATEEKIFIVTAAVQEISGVPIRASDLFRLQPAVAGGTSAFPSLPSGVTDAAHGRKVSVPVFSPAGVLSRIWRVLVAEESAPSTIDAFETLYTEYGVLLRAIAIRGYHIPPDDAEELVHDTFMAFLERHTYIRNVKGWLSATVRNRCMTYLRDRHDRRHNVPLTANDGNAIDQAAQSNIETCIRRLSAAAVFAQLGEKCRETLRGHFLSEESMDCIADRLLISRAYVERLISRCRRRAIEVYRQMVQPRRV